MSKENRSRSWPHRFKVVFRTRSGGVSRYFVITWLTVEKAVVMATAAHVRRNPQGDEIYDVEVNDLGLAPADQQGRVALGLGDLVDRFEF